ncbi:hypothetical protein DPMN_084313 [Dreissena polymorpha]|uniref:Uncharacterized protein n=2 Tax=Dreissena polymorpha TaxID=45954 RepID=A0A9D4BKR5_DREPO|nr:hypothetical protein DPMN_084313 [Dreissena polymorpha]
MPDVLPIGKLRDLGCVCQVYLNTNQFASMNNDVYVKVLYLHGNQCNNDGDNGQPCGCEKDNSRSTVCHNFTPINLSAIMKVAKTESLLMPQRINSLRLPGKNRKRTDSFLQVKNDECSSNGRRKTLHESLRRSKSNSTTA